ncbi:peptidylprolyl isomerase [Salinisphaera sp. LB1]|uniref:peptidylprolyl isomerase n=1 Tax=Salinisphaera sp. LB1 TaxID=2183911 RepID=UPI000D706ECA|nr:peptidylprolyl isomerase [Salinisphaera sp. LB1]AWN15750.1 Peptidyl-prolyl cis-trans isomerase PpiD [Salinisphaera sp. LB1]
MLALVNHVLLPEHQINAESGLVESGTIDEKRAEAARRLAIRELLRQRARALSIATDGRLDAAIDELLAAEIVVPEASDADCRRYFDANRKRFGTPVHVRMSHILLAAAPDDAAARIEARKQADELIAILQRDPDRLAELARTHSRCPSADNGGDLGWVGRGQTVPELEDVVLRLPLGLAQRAVESRYGFHVVVVAERQGGVPLPYDHVRTLIADYLRERSWRRAVSQYLRILIAEADIQGVDIEAVDSPLLQ